MRGASTVLGGVCADLPQKCGKAALSYSTPSNTQISIQATGRHISTPSGACEPEERSPCMNKIDKLDKELEKAREKAAEW